MHILQPCGTATAITGSELNTEPSSVSVHLPIGWSLTIIWFLFPWLWNTCYLFMYTKVFPSLGVVGSKSKNGCASFMSWKEGLCHLLLELSRARRTQNKGTVKNNHIRNVNKGFLFWIILEHFIQIEICIQHKQLMMNHNKAGSIIKLQMSLQNQGKHKNILQNKSVACCLLYEIVLNCKGK